MTLDEVIDRLMALREEEGGDMCVEVRTASGSWMDLHLTDDFNRYQYGGYLDNPPVVLRLGSKHD